MTDLHDNDVMMDADGAEPTSGDGSQQLTLDDGTTVPLPRPPERDFGVGEGVLAFHGQLLYEAKILSVASAYPAQGYRVHYKGWKMSWDENVPRDSVVEHNETNLRIAHELLRSAKVRQSRQAALAQADAPPDADGAARGRREGGDDADEARAERKEKPSMFVMPDVLKRHAVDDWEFVTKERKLVPLPRKQTVAMVVEQWAAANAKGGAAAPDRATRELRTSLLEYFDALLPTMLLYSFERPQFEKYFRFESVGGAEVPRPSDLYGCEHLIRLLVKLPFLLEDKEIEPEVLKTITVKVNQLMAYIKANGRTLLLPVYDDAPKDYPAPEPEPDEG